jgi:TetR/AcrR family transcriptional regulator, tetracycline repressor protein
MVSAGSRTRGRPPSLSEPQIVAAALRLTRELGLDNLSMRALARELGTPPMTIYHYVANREALRDLVVTHILREIRVPTPDQGTWEERLKQLEREARRVLAGHPGVSSQFGDGGNAEAARLSDGVLAMLSEGGFTPEAAVICFTTIYTFIRGQIVLDARDQGTIGGSPHTALDGVTSSARFTRDDLFELGFDAIIEGLKANFLRPIGNVEGR